MTVPDRFVVFSQLFVGGQGPALLLGNEETGTLVGGEGGHADLGAETITIVDAIGVGRFVEGEVTARRTEVVPRGQVFPPSAARESILIGARLIETVIAVLLHDYHTQGRVDVRNGMRFVSSTPDGNGGMVAQTAHLVAGIGLERLVVGHVVISHIEPKVVPHHQAVTVAIVVELLVGDTARPQTNHVVVHVLVQANLGLVVRSVTAKQILAHAPVASTAEDALAIAIDVQYGIIDAVLHYPIVVTTNAEVEGRLVADAPCVAIAGKDFHGTGVEIGVAIAVGPP